MSFSDRELIVLPQESVGNNKVASKFKKRVSMQILDMCAAPGSKTAQLIEMLHADMDVPFPGRKTGRNPCFVSLNCKKNPKILLH